jgi:hypothetical protein
MKLAFRNFWPQSSPTWLQPYTILWKVWIENKIAEWLSMEGLLLLSTDFQFITWVWRSCLSISLHRVSFSSTSWSAIINWWARGCEPWINGPGKTWALLGANLARSATAPARSRSQRRISSLVRASSDRSSKFLPLSCATWIHHVNQENSCQIKN